MAKRKFEKYTATDSDGNESVVHAHVVTDETSGQVDTRTGAQDVRPGDVLVRTSQPHFVDVVPSDVWEQNDYSTKSSDSTDDSEDDDRPGVF